MVLRGSDDFYPREPNSHGPHLYSNAFNALLLANLGVQDWDMFQTGLGLEAGTNAEHRTVRRLIAFDDLVFLLVFKCVGVCSGLAGKRGTHYRLVLKDEAAVVTRGVGGGLRSRHPPTPSQHELAEPPAYQVRVPTDWPLKASSHPALRCIPSAMA